MGDISFLHWIVFAAIGLTISCVPIFWVKFIPRKENKLSGWIIFFIIFLIFLAIINFGEKYNLLSGRNINPIFNDYVNVLWIITIIKSALYIVCALLLILYRRDWSAVLAIAIAWSCAILAPFLIYIATISLPSPGIQYLKIVSGNYIFSLALAIALTLYLLTSKNVKKIYPSR